MRTRDKAFLSCAFVAAVGLLATTRTMAQTPSECTAGNYSVTTSGPTYPSGCGCTEITYTIDGGPSPSHTAAVVASASNDCSGETSITEDSNTKGFGPGVGDPFTGLGRFACHEEVGTTVENHRMLTIRVPGIRTATPKSVAIKQGQKLRSCEIVGLGEVGDGVGTSAPVTETLTHGECSVVFTLNSLTGTVISAALTEDSPAECDLFETDVENLKITVDDNTVCSNPPCDLGLGQFGNGYLQSGSESCTTRIVGGRVYTWGSPCPD